MKDAVIYYGDSTQVNAIDHKNYGEFLKHTEKKQELPGFDAEYLDIVDYILKITHRIWEEKGIGVIYDTYANNCLVHAGDGTSTGVSGVIANTLMTLHAFPDRRLMAEDVVWSEDSPGVFLSSHRILSTGTNLGDSNFGPATGKKVYFRTIADCACAQNKIFEEGLVRDNLWIVKQLGLDPWELAAKMAANQPAKQIYGRDECMEGQIIPEAYQAKDNSVGEQILELLNEVYNRKLINRICDFYADNAVVHSICNQDQIGHDEIQGAIVSLLSSFPNARMIVDRVTCNDNADGSWHVSARWRLRGLHEGIGMYGIPTGKPVEIMGITQYRFENGKIVEAWEIYDGLDVMRQLSLGNESAAEMQ